MKSAQALAEQIRQDRSEGKKYYPFKEMDLFSELFRTELKPGQRLALEQRDFYHNKQVQVLDLLQEVMPGIKTASERHDMGNTQFEKIASHYAKDIVLKPNADRIMLLDPKPDVMAVHTMMGYNKHKDPFTFELLTHDRTRKLVDEPEPETPVREPSLVVDLLTKNSKKDIAISMFGQTQPIPLLPKNAEEYPGLATLSSLAIPKQELATKIQKVYRGHFTRKNNMDLTKPETKAKALNEHYDQARYDNPLYKLRNFKVRDRDILEETKRKELKQKVAERDRFLGMNLQELIIAAARDPFKHKLDSESLGKNYDGVFDRLRLSQVDRGLKLDQLKWDIEESRISPRNGGIAKPRGGRPRGSPSRNTLSNTDLGYSDDIEFDLQNNAESSYGGGKSSIEMDSIIEDLARSRSLSSHHVKGRAKGTKDPRGHFSRDSSINENDSSGFGFIRAQPQATQGLNKNHVERIHTESSDSNPFGVVRRIESSPVNLQPKSRLRDQKEPDRTEEAHIKISTTKEELGIPREKRESKAQQYYLERLGQVYLGLDSDIYGPLKEKEPYKPKMQSVHKAGDSSSVAIQKTLASVYQSLKHNAEVIKDISPEDRTTDRAALKPSQRNQIAVKESERLSQELLQQLVRTREALANNDQIVDLLVGYFEKTQQDIQPLQQDYPVVSQQVTLPNEDFFTGEAFMNLYANAVKSKESLAAIDLQRHEMAVRQLEQRIRRLTNSEGQLEEAISRHRKMIEREKDEILRRFNRALQEKRRQRTAALHRPSKKEEAMPSPSKRDAVRSPSRGQKPTGGQTGKDMLKRVSSPVITEESVESGTVVSDYNESKELIQNISWLDSVSEKPQKFTTFN